MPGFAKHALTTTEPGGMDLPGFTEPALFLGFSTWPIAALAALSCVPSTWYRCPRSLEREFRKGPLKTRDGETCFWVTRSGTSFGIGNLW